MEEHKCLVEQVQQQTFSLKEFICKPETIFIIILFGFFILLAVISLSKLRNMSNIEKEVIGNRKKINDIVKKFNAVILKDNGLNECNRLITYYQNKVDNGIFKGGTPIFTLLGVLITASVAINKDLSRYTLMYALMLFIFICITFLIDISLREEYKNRVIALNEIIKTYEEKDNKPMVTVVVENKIGLLEIIKKMLDKK